MSQDRNLNDGAVGRALFAVSAPMTLGILGVLSVGLADAYFLAKAGATELAAISYIFPVIATLTSLSIGLAAGTNAVISQAIGQGEDGADRDRLTLHAMMLAFLLSCLTAVLFYFGAPMVFSLMGARDAVLDAVMGYIRFWCLSFPFLVTGMALNAAFRAAGKTVVAASVMLGQSIVNIALNPVFIFGFASIPEMGADGAGLATLVARIAGFLGVLVYGCWVGAVCLNCAPFRHLATSFRRIGRIGAPAAFSNAINPAGMAIVTAAIATIGDAAVAGFGAATRVQSLLLVPMLALSSGIGPVVGQAWGADMQQRARDAMRLAFLWCIAIGFCVATILFIFAEPIADVMTSGAEEAKFAVSYMRIASWGFFCYGILITANAAMNARDRALWSMSVSAVRIFVIYVPLTWFGVWVAGYTGMLFAAVAANVIGAWIALIAAHSVGLVHLDWRVVRGPAERLRGAFA